MSAAPDLLIFDCDGTLVDSERLASTVFAELLGGLGVEAEPEALLREFRGRQLATCVAELAARHGTLPADFTDQFRARSAELFRAELREIEGAAELLAGLPQPVCVASNAPRTKIEICLEATGLAPFFGPGRIFSAYEVGAWKPAPDLFLHAAAALGVEPARCLVVEDSEPGVAAALAAGMRVVALLHEPAPAWLPAGVPGITRLAGLRALV